MPHVLMRGRPTTVAFDNGSHDKAPGSLSMLRMFITRISQSSHFETLVLLGRDGFRLHTHTYYIYILYIIYHIYILFQTLVS